LIISSERQMRPALSNGNCTDSLPMMRLRTTFFGSPFGNASKSAINCAISSGGNTRKQVPD